jgi:phosphate-selective porin OprO/OprP
MSKVDHAAKRQGRTILPFMLFVVFFLLTGGLNGQEKDLIPDGTQGEELEVVKSDSSRLKWKEKRWRLFNGKITTFKFGGGFLYDFAAFAPDENSRKQMDSLGTPLESKFKVRDFRLIASGQFKTRRTISWKLGLMYDATQESWLVRETGLTIHVPEIKSIFFVGRTKEGYSLNKVMNGYFGWGFERMMALDVIPILADGVKWMGYLPEKKLFWNLGIFTDWLSKDQSFSTYKWQFAARAGWLPVYDEKNNKVLHVGLNYRYGEVDGGEIQVRSKPEVNIAPYFVSTGKFASGSSSHLAYEIYYKTGPWLFGSEYHWIKFDSPKQNDPLFHGGEIMMSYMFTGESRVYSPSTSILGHVPVKKTVFKGGPGAIEGVLRLTNMDLDGGNILGGKIWRITPMFNWYMSTDVRFELGYGYSVLDRFGIKGGTHIFQTRLQLTLL